jgi:hypothetical protein
MSNITWQFQATIPKGPTISLNTPPVTIQAYDVVATTIGAGASGVAVKVQPSTTTGDIVFVVVSSDQYDAGITYKVDSSTDAHALDGPHVLLGAGAVGFMNAGAPPQTLTFSSTFSKDANVQIVVGRKNP